MVKDGGKRQRRWLRGRDLVAGVGFDDPTALDERGDDLAEGRRSDPAVPAELLEGNGAVGVEQSAFDATERRRWRGAGLRGVVDLQGEPGLVSDEAQRDVGDSSGGVVLDGEDRCLALAPEVQIRVARSVKLRGAAQGLAGPDVSRPLAGVVDDKDGKVVLALQLPQKGEQRRDLLGSILVDTMQTHEGIEDEQRWFQVGDGVGKGLAIIVDVEPQGRSGDHLDIEVDELQLRSGAEGVEAVTDDVQSVLGGEEQHATWTGDSKAPKARTARGDRNAELEGEQRLAALGLAAEDTDRLVAPQLLDKPLLVWRSGSKPTRRHDGKHHRRRLRLVDAVFGFDGGGGLGTLKVSR